MRTPSLTFFEPISASTCPVGANDPSTNVALFEKLIAQRYLARVTVGLPQPLASYPRSKVRLPLTLQKLMVISFNLQIVLLCKVCNFYLRRITWSVEEFRKLIDGL